MLNLTPFNCNLSAWLYQASNLYSDSIAFDGITYKQLYAIVEAHSKEIKEITAGKTVAILADSDEQYALWAFAFFQLNVRFLNLSSNNSTFITVDLIMNSGADVLIYDKKYQAHAIQVAIQQPQIKLIQKYLIKKDVQETKSIINKEVQKEDIATVFHFSGSTSNPKLIYHSSAYYIKNCFRFINKINLQKHQQISIMAPLYRAFGFKIL